MAANKAQARSSSASPFRSYPFILTACRMLRPICAAIVLVFRSTRITSSACTFTDKLMLLGTAGVSLAPRREPPFAPSQVEERF